MNLWLRPAASSPSHCLRLPCLRYIVDQTLRDCTCLADSAKSGADCHFVVLSMYPPDSCKDDLPSLLQAHASCLPARHPWKRHCPCEHVHQRRQRLQHTETGTGLCRRSIPARQAGHNPALCSRLPQSPAPMGSLQDAHPCQGEHSFRAGHPTNFHEVVMTRWSSEQYMLPLKVVPTL